MILPPIEVYCANCGGKFRQGLINNHRDLHPECRPEWEWRYAAAILGRDTSREAFKSNREAAKIVESSEAMKKSRPKIAPYLHWLRGVQAHGGGFLRAFHEAWIVADPSNREILEAPLRKLMEKYPDYIKLGRKLNGEVEE